MGASRQRVEVALERLMPTLNPKCSVPEGLRWPQRLALTGLLTPFDATENPAPTEVLYDHSRVGAR
jgi:hypothetical protein